MSSRSDGSLGVGDTNLCKALFRSPAKAEEDMTSNATKTLMNKLQIDHDVELCLKNYEKDLHDQRLKDLRQLEKVIAEDNWRFTPIEKLIGL